MRISITVDGAVQEWLIQAVCHDSVAVNHINALVLKAELLKYTYKGTARASSETLDRVATTFVAPLRHFALIQDSQAQGRMP